MWWNFSPHPELLDSVPHLRPHCPSVLLATAGLGQRRGLFCSGRAPLPPSMERLLRKLRSAGAASWPWGRSLRVCSLLLALLTTVQSSQVPPLGLCPHSILMHILQCRWEPPALCVGPSEPPNSSHSLPGRQPRCHDTRLGMVWRCRVPAELRGPGGPGSCPVLSLFFFF